MTFQVIPYRCYLWSDPCHTLLPSLPRASWWPSGAVFITGTPGIGKSSMLLYILWQLAKAKTKVVLHTRNGMLLFSGCALALGSCSTCLSTLDMRRHWES